MRRLAKAVASLVALMGVLAIAQAAQGAPAQCNRSCLKNTADKYLASLVAHDPSQVSLAPNVKFVENTIPMHPGDGLWKTASAVPTTFKIYVADPVSEEIGFLGVMQENNKPVPGTAFEGPERQDHRSGTPDSAQSHGKKSG